METVVLSVHIDVLLFWMNRLASILDELITFADGGDSVPEPCLRFEMGKKAQWVCTLQPFLYGHSWCLPHL